MIHSTWFPEVAQGLLQIESPIIMNVKHVDRSGDDLCKFNLRTKMSPNNYLHFSPFSQKKSLYFLYSFWILKIFENLQFSF